MANIEIDELFERMLQKKNNLEYIGEGEIKSLYEGKLQQHLLFEEFVDKKGRRKFVTNDLLTHDKTITLHDGKQIISYEKSKGIAYKFANDENVSNFHSGEWNFILTKLKESHTIEGIQEEKINDRFTYHLVAKAKNDFFGEVIEIWFDQQTFATIKTVVINREIKTIFEYKNIDFSPHFTVDTFTLHLPDSVEIKDVNEQFASKTGSIEDAEKELGRPFLVLNEKNWRLDRIELDYIGLELMRTEVNLYYELKNGSKLIISIFNAPTEKEMEIRKGDIKVRGNEAEYCKVTRSITWDEDLLRYTMIFLNTDLTLNGARTLAEKMTYPSNINKQA